MKTILAVLILVCAVIYVLAEIVRNTMLSARRAEYANGVKVDIVSKEELLQKFKGLNSFLIKQVYYNQDGCALFYNLLIRCGTKSYPGF